MGIGSFLGSVGNFLTNRPGENEQRQGLLGMAQTGTADYNRLGGELGGESDYLRRIARGQDSVSAEQLRQGIGQVTAAQQAMAAGAAPQNQAMAALMASRNAMQAQSGMAGQQALAGMQERQAAQSQLMDALLRRQQMAQNAQGSYAQIQPGQSWLDRFGGAVQGGVSLFGLGGFGGGGSPTGYQSGPRPGGGYAPPIPR